MVRIHSWARWHMVNEATVNGASGPVLRAASEKMALVIEAPA